MQTESQRSLTLSPLLVSLMKFSESLEAMDLLGIWTLTILVEWNQCVARCGKADLGLSLSLTIAVHWVGLRLISVFVGCAHIGLASAVREALQCFLLEVSARACSRPSVCSPHTEEKEAYADALHAKLFRLEVLSRLEIQPLGFRHKIVAGE